MNIIFTGASYWKVPNLPEKSNVKGDFTLVSGYRWIKTKKKFSATAKLFACPKHYQLLTVEEIEAQGLKS